MRVGLSFRQTMSGSYWRLNEPTDERAIAFAIVVDAEDLGAVVRHKTWRATGHIEAERLAAGRPVDGTITFYLARERRAAYRLTFTGDDGQTYELCGLAEWSGMDPVESLSRLPASLYDAAGEEIARATLRFDLRADWLTLMRSLRLHVQW